MNQGIDDEAARWMALRLSGELSQEDQRRYADWLAQSPDNAAAIRRYEAVLSAADDAAGAALAEEFERELNDAYDGKQRRGRPPVFHAIAASVAALFVVAVAVAVMFTRSAAPEAQLYASAIGEQRSVSFEDGSLAHLNTNSALAVTYAPDRRQVRMQKGEALFDVEAEAARPFLVETSLASIRVTGTVFSVQAFPEETKVLVVSGAVEVTPNGAAPVHVTPGQRIRIDREGAFDIVNVDSGNALAWRMGKARYAGAPLGDVIADLNRYFRTPMALADSGLATIPVTGEFDTTDQNLVIRSLSVAFGLHSWNEDGRILLSPTNE